jgi:hypothetical protein
MHVQSSHSEKTIKIFSGAFQPEQQAETAEESQLHFQEGFCA